MGRAKYAALICKERKHPVLAIYYTNGSKKTKTLKVDDKTAQRLVDRLNRDITLGVFNNESLFPVSSTKTLKTYFDEYLAYRRREADLGRLSPRTPEVDANAANKLLTVLGPQYKLCQVTSNTIEKFIDVMRQQNLSNPTINTYLRMLRVAFAWTLDIKHNPLVGIKKLPEERNIKYLTPDMIAQLREHFSQRPAWQLDALNMALWTGIRLESIGTMKTTDLLGEGDRKFLRVKEKGSHGKKKERFIPLHAAARQLIADRSDRVAAAVKDISPFLSRGTSPKDIPTYRARAKEGFLFFEVKDTHSMSQAFVRAKRALGITGVRFHDLRKTFATSLVDSGISMDYTAEILGHSDSRITRELYAKITRERLAKEMDRSEIL